MSLAIVQEYGRLVDADDFDGAAKLVADDISASSPKGSYTGIEKWRAAVVNVKNEGVDWGEFKQGDKENEIVCDGVKKITFVKLSVKRTITVNGDGKIQSIIVKKA